MDDLLGNSALRARLRRAAAHGRLHHCLLFEGPEGIGKHSTALRFAQELNCLGAAPPCGSCSACRQIRAGTHPDLLDVGPDPEKLTVVVSVAQVHAILQALQLKAHSARHRFVIIDPADALNEESANALLKTLEEPPADTRFVLVSARPATLLPTIRSRSQRVRFAPVPRPELEAWLRGRGLDPAFAEEADGSPGLALRLAEGESVGRREVEAALFGVIGQPLQASFAFAEAYGKKEEGQAARTVMVVDAVETLLRDLGRAANGRPVPGEPERARRLRAWAPKVWPEGASRLADHAALARERMKANVSGRVVLEALLAALQLELRHVEAR